MAKTIQAIFVSVVCFGCFLAAIRVTGAPINSSRISDDKVESVVRHKNVESKAEQKSDSATTANSSLKQEVKSKPANSPSPKLVLNPVPGQLEKRDPAATPLKKPVIQPKPSSPIRTQEIQSSDDVTFLKEAGENRKGTESESGTYETWQNLLSDPRWQTILENYEEQQRLQSDLGLLPYETHSNNNNYYNSGLVEYLERVGELDRTLDDLVSAGVITPQEAISYRQAFELQYGAPVEPAPSDYLQQVVEAPEDTYDYQAADDIYGGASDFYGVDNYIQPAPSNEYSNDYVNLPIPNSVVQDDAAEDEDDVSTGEEQGEEEELIRNFLGLLPEQQEKERKDGGDDDQASESNQSPEKILAPGKASTPVSGSVTSQSDGKSMTIEKELESLPVIQVNSGKKPETKGADSEEELQLEEIKNRKTKQENRTKQLSKERLMADKQQ